MRKSNAVFLMIAAFLLTRGPYAGAQTTIVTNYNTCMQGVKDKNGNWVIDAKYDVIKEQTPNYIVTVNGRSGLIDKSGTVLIPAIYENLKPLYAYNHNRQFPNYMIADNGNSNGIVDTMNNIIVPFEYGDMYPNADTVVVMRKGGTEWTFTNLKGGYFLCPWKGYWHPERIAPHTYSMPTERYFMRRYGMCNDSGKILLKQKYTRLNGDGETNCVRVSKRRKYGYCRTDGTFTWPVAFDYETRWVTYRKWYDYPITRTAGPAQRGKRVGLINRNGDVLIPFEYDEIKPFHDDNYGRSKNLWIVMRDSLFGLYDDATGWKIPVECSSIESVHTFYTSSDSTALGLLIYKIGDKWGAATSSGQKVLPCIYDEVMNIPKTKSYVFREGGSLIALHVNSNEVSYNYSLMLAGLYPLKKATYSNETYMSVAEENLQFHTFRGNEGVVAFYNPDMYESTEWSDAYYHKATSGNYFQFTVPDTVAMKCAFFTRPLADPVAGDEEIKIFSDDRIEARSMQDRVASIVFIPGRKTPEKMSVIQVRSVRPGFDYFATSGNDFIAENGRIIVRGDTVSYGRIEYNGASGTPFFMVRHERPKSYSVVDTNGQCNHYRKKDWIADYNYSHYWVMEKYAWVLKDANDRSVLPPKTSCDFPYPLWDSVTIIHNDDHGRRLYNYITKKFLTTFPTANVLPLRSDGAAFAVKTCSGHMGIISSTGEWITDTMWTAVKGINYFATYAGYSGLAWYYQQEYPYHKWYILSNADSSAVFHHLYGMRSEEDMHDHIWNFCSRVETKTTVARFVNDSSGRILGTTFCMAPDDTTQLIGWHRGVIIDTIYSSQRGNATEAETRSGYWSGNDILSCRYCRSEKFPYFTYVWNRESTQRQVYFPSLIGDSVLSFSAGYNGYAYLPSFVARKWCSNVFLFPDGPRCMTIDSMFNPQSDWRTFLINTVLNYVSSHDKITGDCHFPNAIPGLLNDRFLITSQGFLLMPPDFQERNCQLQILVTWQELNPYLRADVKTKLPVTP